MTFLMPVPHTQSAISENITTFLVVIKFGYNKISYFIQKSYNNLVDTMNKPENHLVQGPVAFVLADSPCDMVL